MATHFSSYCKALLIPLTFSAFISCSPSPKKLSTVETGMSKEEVIAIVGNPPNKNVVNKTEIWDYPDSNRTIIFRMDTVYRIITSAEARADSVGMWLDKTDDKLKDQFKDLAGKADSTADKIKNKLTRDSSKSK